ncbi:hypothetical protein Slin15195_G052490 [Septoria linicola]|uniref:Uncharacterized protein n=1 Tax=Septoria linicola TaxID=215465 RepID=A0A9Q9EID9_9PEZI|nr:hypothetical protein Slin14017_G127970 [Septoria linicola]USW51930.1 hypothetical protein Slin15195_G052490 [Septoria linicola]
MADLYQHDKEARVATSEAGSGHTRDEDLRAQTRVERVFNKFQFSLLTLTFMSSWEAIAGNLYTVFYNGGPQALV